jgi:hypothetical protein
VSKASFEQVSWQAVREDVIAVAPQLAALIDGVGPDKQMPLYRVRYPFGAPILTAARLQLPSPRGKVVPIDDPALPSDVREHLQPGLDQPMGLVLKNATEAFIPMQDRIIPIQLKEAGDLFGLWRALGGTPANSFHPSRIWSMTAGARTLFMSPKISDHAGQRRVNREFGLRSLAPKNMMDHWRLFVDIANHRHFTQDWDMEILFFSHRWFEKRDDAPWLAFRNHLLEVAWQETCFWRNKYFWDFIFSCAQETRNLKPNPYVMDTVKHILVMATGTLSGFTLATNDTTGPISTLQDIYKDVYQIKQYAPLIFHAESLRPTREKGIYYSLQYPTSLEFSPKSRSLASAMENLREIKYVLEAVLQEILAGKIPLDDTLLYRLLQNIKFDYFHSDADPYQDICLSSTIPDEDIAIANALKQFPDRKFADTASFVRGCVRMMVNSSNGEDNV